MGEHQPQLFDDRRGAHGHARLPWRTHISAWQARCSACHPHVLKRLLQLGARAAAAPIHPPVCPCALAASSSHSRVRARLAQNFNALLDFVSIDDGELHGTAPSPPRSRVQAAAESGDVAEELARIAQQARQARDAQQAANAAQAEAEAQAQAQAAAAQEAAKAARMQATKEALANARATSGQNEEPADDPQ